VQADPAALAAANGPAITRQIADQVIKSVEGKSTRFDIALNPAGLGQVNVKVEINAAGQVSASLSFDNPHAAAEARAHVGELQRALEQAGFNLSQGGLSFDVGGQGASLARQNQGQPFTAPGAAAAQVLADAAEPVPSLPASPRAYAASGVNIVI
jgi:flagellar hook-length control protein FliK